MTISSIWPGRSAHEVEIPELSVLPTPFSFRRTMWKMITTIMALIWFLWLSLSINLLLRLLCLCLNWCLVLDLWFLPCLFVTVCTCSPSTAHAWRPLTSNARPAFRMSVSDRSSRGALWRKRCELQCDMIWEGISGSNEVVQFLFCFAWRELYSLKALKFFNLL